MPDDLPERISASQLRVLLTVRALGRPTVTELADRLESLPSSVTRLCDRLVSAGYLDRGAAADNRRFHVVEVSPTGRDLLQRIDLHRTEMLDGFLRRMPDRARRQLETGLSAFAAAAQAGPGAERRDEDGVDGSRPAVLSSVSRRRA